MSAVVCGKRRSIFDELPGGSPSPVSKKIRCSSSASPTRFSLLSLVDRLRESFPLLDQQLIEQTLEECGGDTEAAIKRLHGLCLGATEDNIVTSVNVGTHSAEAEQQPAIDSSSQNALPSDGAQWVELLVGEMSNASSMDDARARAARALEVLEKTISARVSGEAVQSLQNENIMLKERIQELMHENDIAKGLVKKLHESGAREVQLLKQQVSQYQEQLRKQEVINYGLRMHLEQAQRSNPMPGRFHPDVF